MNLKDRKVLEKILDHAAAIVQETQPLGNAEEFRNNDLISKAALFDLLQIGELAKDGLSQELIHDLSAIPWPQIYALRNRIVHGYAFVDYQIIWETIREDIPRLIEALGEALEKP